MLFQELFPGRSFDSFGGRLDAVPFQDIADGIPRYRVTEICQCTLNPSVPPAPVLVGHAKD